MKRFGFAYASVIAILFAAGCGADADDSLEEQDGELATSAEALSIKCPSGEHRIGWCSKDKRYTYNGCDTNNPNAPANPNSPPTVRGTCTGTNIRCKDYGSYAACAYNP